MTVEQDGIDELDIAAAQIAAAMLDFAQVGLPAAIRHSDALDGRVGEAGFKLFPSEVVVPRVEAPLALLELRKPIAIASLSTKGLFGTWPMTGPDDDAAAYFERARGQNRANFAKAVSVHDLRDDSPVRLTIDEKVAVFPVAALDRFFRDYVIFLSWVLHAPRSADDPHARLLLVRADGLCSTGEFVTGVPA